VADSIPSRQSRFSRVPTPPRRSLAISPSQWRVYVALSEPGTIFQIAARTVQTEVEVVEAVQMLLEQTLIQPAVDPPTGRRKPPA
jgi:hypothetical protein